MCVCVFLNNCTWQKFGENVVSSHENNVANAMQNIVVGVNFAQKPVL